MDDTPSPKEAEGSASIRTLPSIHDVDPTEWGGTIARIGFGYQDHVAVAFCVRMLTDARVEAVWCEVFDDVTVLSSHDGRAEVEFVQVKGAGSSVWSLTDLCGRVGGRIGSSLLEKSLNHDRCCESVKFRIATESGVQSDLRLLRLPCDHEDRQLGSAAFDSLLRAITNRLPDARSPNNNDAAYWANRATWEVEGDENSVIAKSSMRLGEFLFNVFDLPAPDHRQAIYDLLLFTVFEAAKADRASRRDEKKIAAQRLKRIVRERVQELRSPSVGSLSRRLRNALLAIGMTPEDVEHVVLRYYRYVADERSEPFLSTADDEAAYLRVDRALHDLRMERQRTGQPQDGLTFYQSSVEAVRAVHAAVDDRISLEHKLGILHSLIAYELHRLDVGRASAPSGGPA